MATDLGPSAGFDRGARRYDLLVALNPGYHRHLRSAARLLADRTGGEVPPGLVDLGCGSGASTRALVAELPAGVDVVGIDASEGMLALARAKRWPPGVTFLRGRAEDFPDVTGNRATRKVDGVLAAYLFRNVPADLLDDTLARVLSTLTPGGYLVVQDYALAPGRLPRWIWHLVCWLVVIPLSGLVLRDTSLYRYLWRSVLSFDSADDFARRLLAAGFTDVAYRSVDGWQAGILHTFVARRPDDS